MTTFLWGPQEPLIQKIPGPAFLMHDDDSGRCQMFKVGIPELALVEFARKISRPDSVFIDGGAHMGVYSILLADRFKEVHAFEPQRRTYNQLCGNIFINEKNNIYTHNVALTNLANANTTKTLSIVSDDGGGSTLQKTTEHVQATELVKTATIDSLHLDSVGLIKLDVEGSEYEAIEGAQHTIKRCNYPPILFEANGHSWYNYTNDKLFKLLQDMNYQIMKTLPFENMYVARQGTDLLA